MQSRLTRRRFTTGALGTLGAAATLTTARPTRAADALTFQANWLNDPEFIGYMLAIDKGFYKAEGLDITYIPGGPIVVPRGRFSVENPMSR